MKLLNRYITNIPLLALVVANVIPLWGVLYLGWDAFYILLLYWSENLVIGFYGILKIAFAKAPNLAAHLSKIFIIPFFIIHYGGFMAGHGLFVLSSCPSSRRRMDSSFKETIGHAFWSSFSSCSTL
jgi:hypothetical protein